ncbi:hypothetical protein [Kribbella catacumbae]|uniref:hypothetical protein n=1 Tax=Kribbella catacumbae TaxID=460086 RepID=UPI0003732AE2|nr:hypothetical protein [Kribbella catacumbae]
MAPRMCTGIRTGLGDLLTAGQIASREFRPGQPLTERIWCTQFRHSGYVAGTLVTGDAHGEILHS